LRIIFAGTPQFSADHLQALLDQGQHQVVAVYTQPDRRSGRGKKLHASPVKKIAEHANIPVLQPLTLKDEDALQALAQLNADVMIVAAYGLLLPQLALDTPKFGCINIHASLLPRWRGAAPIERAIIAGDKISGITIMQMAIGLDTGDMLFKSSCDIAADETGDSLRSKMTALGIPLLFKALSAIDADALVPEQQNDSDSNYAVKIDKKEALIDWHQSAEQIDRKIRAFTSAMGCHTFLNDQRIRIIKAAPIASDKDNTAGTVIAINKKTIVVQCNNSCLEISMVQIPGAKAMDIVSLLNGRPDFFTLGDCFSSPIESEQ
jgi:methionyl-tRNA formyltransferase